MFAFICTLVDLFVSCCCGSIACVKECFKIGNGFNNLKDVNLLPRHLVTIHAYDFIFDEFHIQCNKLVSNIIVYCITNIFIL